MEKVTNKKLYHIHRINKNRPLGINDTLETSSEYNSFFRDYDTKDIPQVFNVNGLLTYYWHFARETAVEEVRVSINNDLPSRKRCLWLTDVRSLDYWIGEVNFNPKEFQLLELEVTGAVFKCDASFIEGNPMKLNDVRERAIRYWSGEILDTKKVEYLFEGTAKVTRVLELSSAN
ncbi:DUF2441 domain-containing protein [Cytobacillus firmus]|uniref:DUF2441 domain-containing protein n=1 Tax=Cytobacillus firmus TaxID=1399 RepID=A0A800MU26_CYTFI|nr:DUF2441 domain-containing protein [Cytobacillus firmus]KAF0822524.1 hypothetical protein KIS1582_3741 [Cytobacillus firmus]